jgi:hypothetical protein
MRPDVACMAHTRETPFVMQVVKRPPFFGCGPALGRFLLLLLLFSTSSRVWSLRPFFVDIYPVNEESGCSNQVVFI